MDETPGAARPVRRGRAWSIAAVLLLVLGAAGAATLVAARTRRLPERLPWVGNRPESLALLPPCAPDSAFSFAVVGDPEEGTYHFVELLRLEREHAPAFVIIPGDVVKNPGRERYGYFLKAVADLGWRVPILCAVGNSDIEAGKPEVFEEFLGPRVFHFEYGGCLFVFLDNAHGKVGPDQIALLDRLLAADRARFRHVFVVLHKPLLASQVPADVEEEKAGWQAEPELRERVRRYHVDYLLAAHLHGYQREEAAGTTCLVTGGGGGHRQQAGIGFHLIEVRVAADGCVRERMLSSGDDVRPIAAAVETWHDKVLPAVRGNFGVALGVEALLLAGAGACWGRARRGGGRGRDG